MEADQNYEPLRWPARLPFIIIGLLLGGSLWYVARRLYGNAGGYTALALYCFSPAAVASGRVGPNIVAMLGLFGIIYISIALAHTFYPPPPGVGFLKECSPRWRRVLLLAAAVLLALGAAPQTALALPIALAFMLYLLPDRQRWWLPFAVLAATTGIAGFILWGLHGFSAAALAQQLSLSVGTISTSLAVTRLRMYSISVLWLTHYPALALFLVLALAAYLASRRLRYFGNTVPLLVIALLALAAVTGLSEDTLAYGAFPLRALPFVCLFLGGIAADMLEGKPRTQRRDIVLAMLVAMLASNALIALLELKRTGGSGHPTQIRITTGG
jgi:MFS family permease